jgi:hypothetical protein
MASRRRRPAALRALAPTLAAALVLLRAAAAPAFEAPLRELPGDKLAAMAPLLRHGEVALIESQPDGRMRQVTVIALAAAPVEKVREVLLLPERFPEFIKGLDRANVSRHPDGSFDYDMEIDLKLTKLETSDHVKPQPDGSLYVTSNNQRDGTTYRWQLLPVAGGTVIVQYGYVHVLNARPFIQRLVLATPTLEHGLALSLQLFFVRAIKMRAEKVAVPGSWKPLDPAAKGPGFKFLLERGRVAVIRSTPEGRLADVSILDTVYAAVTKVEQAILDARDYAKFVDGVKKSYDTGGTGAFELEQDLSIFTWTTRFALHAAGAAVDVAGLQGDLRSAHYRWDLSVQKPKETLVVYRAAQNLMAASPLLLGPLFREQPTFEHGLSVSIGLLYVAGIRGHAEGWK